MLDVTIRIGYPVPEVIAGDGNHGGGGAWAST
jgi:hypothetical protein